MALLVFSALLWTAVGAAAMGLYLTRSRPEPTVEDEARRLAGALEALEVNAAQRERIHEITSQYQSKVLSYLDPVEAQWRDFWSLVHQAEKEVDQAIESVLSPEQRARYTELSLVEFDS